MFLQFLRNHPDSNKPAFNNALIDQGEPWRLHFHHVESLWADRDIAGDGSKIYSYHLTMADGSTTKVLFGPCGNRGSAGSRQTVSKNIF